MAEDPNPAERSALQALPTNAFEARRIELGQANSLALVRRTDRRARRSRIAATRNLAGLIPCSWLRGRPAHGGQAGFLPRRGSYLASLHADFHCFRVGFRCRNRLFLIRRRFRLVFRSDFVMLASILPWGVHRVSQRYHRSPAGR